METGYAMAEESSRYQRPKKKKPGLIKRWFAKMSREVWDDERRNSILRDDGNDIISSKQARVTISGSQPTNIDQPERAIQFTVYNANGGRVIETRRYDRHKDRHSNGLYVITTDQDFGREIDKIITMESLR